MAIMITDSCINCGACESECPNNAIYEGGSQWTWADGTSLTGNIEFGDGTVVSASAKQAALSDDFYFVVSGKCTECLGFHEEPQCSSVCPEDCCVKDPDMVESEEELLTKKEW